MVNKRCLFFLTIAVVIVGYAMEKQNKEDIGNYYDKNSQVQQHNGKKLVQEYVGDVTICTYVTDWGCGTGALIEDLAKQYPQTKFCGIDISASMIESAQKRCALLANVSFENQDAAKHYNSGSCWQIFNPAYNLALCTSTAHWIENQEQLLQNIAFGLKNSGKVLISMAGDDGKSVHPLKVAWKLVMQKNTWSHCLSHQTEAPYYPLTINSMATMLDQAGLKASILKIVEQKRQFENKTELEAWARGWAGSMQILDSIPQESRTVFVDELLQVYADQIPCAADGSITYTIPNLICIAHKKD